MATIVNSLIAARFRSGAGLCFTFPQQRNNRSSNDSTIAHPQLSHCNVLDSKWHRAVGISFCSSIRRNHLSSTRNQAAAGQLGPGSDYIVRNERPLYHPLEEITELAPLNVLDAQLTPAETSRTLVEVNSKATLILSDLGDGEILDNLFWPDLPYVTDEDGNIYFMVNGDESILQSITSDNNLVQVIIGLDTAKVIKAMEFSGLSEIDFDLDEIEDEGGDLDDFDDGDEDGGDWVSILDVDDSDSLGDWAGLETLRFIHPIHFAKTLVEVVSETSKDWMELPPAGISIKGLLTPVIKEEQSDNQKKRLDKWSIRTEKDTVVNTPTDGSVSVDALENSESDRLGILYYKLELVKIHLVSSHGHQTAVEVENYTKVCPDAIAHSASRIMSRLKDSGETTTRALKSLCWRLKGIQVEEAAMTGIDSLGFDIRVCSDTQIQTLRFGFNKRATSEFSAERQLNDLLYPRVSQKLQMKTEAI